MAAQASSPSAAHPGLCHRQTPCPVVNEHSLMKRYSQQEALREEQRVNVGGGRSREAGPDLLGSEQRQTHPSDGWVTPTRAQPAAPAASPRLPRVFGLPGSGSAELSWQDRRDGQGSLHCPATRDCFLLSPSLLTALVLQACSDQSTATQRAQEAPNANTQEVSPHVISSSCPFSPGATRQQRAEKAPHILPCSRRPGEHPAWLVAFILTKGVTSLAPARSDTPDSCRDRNHG